MRYTLAAISIYLLAVCTSPTLGQLVMFETSEEDPMNKCEAKGRAVGTVAVRNACRAFLQKCNPDSALPEAAPDNIVKNGLQKLLDEIDARPEEPLFETIVEDACETLYTTSCAQSMTAELSSANSMGDCGGIIFDGKAAENCQSEDHITTEWTSAVENACSVE